jgi:hypothetical protein
MSSRQLWSLGVVAVAVVMLAGCRNDLQQPSPLAVSDYRLGAIAQQAGRVSDIDSEMLAVDAEAYGRPAGADFRDAVAKFYDATHPACLVWSGEETPQEHDFAAEAKPPLRDFDALVAKLELMPLRRDLELAWQRAALGNRKAAASRACAANDETQREIMRNATALMRDALDRMEAAMNAAAS